MLKKIILFIFLFWASNVFAIDFGYDLNLVYSQKGDIEIEDVSNFRLFYDDLKENPRNYLINSEKDFNLSFSILVPPSNKPKR